MNKTKGEIAAEKQYWQQVYWRMIQIIANEIWARPASVGLRRGEPAVVNRD